MCQLQSIPAPYNRLWSKMWKTKGARFKAHSRLKLLATSSTTAISFLSFYVIAASLVQFALSDSLPKLNNTLMTVGAITASILILVLTLLENIRNHSLVADHMHRCGLEITILYNEYDALVRSDPQSVNLVDYSKRYSEILARYPENHDSLDFLMFKCDNPAEFDINWRQRLQAKASFASQFFLYAFLVMLAPSFFAILFIIR